MKKNPLGIKSQFPEKYKSSLLFSISRSKNRLRLGLSRDLSFSGKDFWNLYEVSWLQGGKSTSLKPVVAVLQLAIPFDSENLLESKSVKLYFNSLNNEIFSNEKEVMALIRKDVTRALGISESSKSFSIIKIDENQYKKRFRKIITGNNANYQSSLNPEILRQGKIYPELIQCKKSKVMNRVFMTHLFRSLCPVTGQPDWATVYIRYSGNLILENTLFDYLLTYRNHPDFHEHCCERIFSDISNQAKPQSLLVSCHFTRRGGIDINPIRHSLGIQIKWNKIWESHYRQ